MPNAWRSRLAKLAVYDTVDLETANQVVVTGDFSEPALLRFGLFRRVFEEVLFIDRNLSAIATSHFSVAFP